MIVLILTDTCTICFFFNSKDFKSVLIFSPAMAVVELFTIVWFFHKIKLAEHICDLRCCLPAENSSHFFQITAVEKFYSTGLRRVGRQGQAGRQPNNISRPFWLLFVREIEEEAFVILFLAVLAPCHLPNVPFHRIPKTLPDHFVSLLSQMFSNFLWP